MTLSWLDARKKLSEKQEILMSVEQYNNNKKHQIKLI